MERLPRILVVDDEPALRRVLKRILVGLPADVTDAVDGVDALAKLEKGTFDLILTDLRMPGADGFAVLRGARERSPATPVVMLTANGSLADCVTAIRGGAENFLAKPFHDGELLDVVRGAIDRPRGTAAQALVGDSEPLRRVLALVERVARSASTVLVVGESGTGKEVVARLLHGLSDRATGPLVAVNCGAIPESLVESELFGHAKGAFTGATERRIGRFAQADRGTIFLDEIGELPLAVQVKLLRVLQEREVTPVGDSTVQKIDVRIVAATNRDLGAMVREGTFREDLWYRLNVIPIEMPALRERAADVPLLVEHFLARANGRHGRRIRVSPAAMTRLAAWSWPGNVRELENLVERLVVLAAGDEVREDELPAAMRGAAPVAPPGAPPTLPETGLDLQRRLDETEWALIDEALRQTGGNKARAAALLGLKRTTLSEKLKRRGQSD